MDSFYATEIVIPVAGFVISVATEIIFVYLNDQEASLGLSPTSRNARKSIVYALEIISSMCSRNKNVKLQPYEMVFLLKAFEIPLLEEEDFVYSLERQKAEQIKTTGRSYIQNIDINVNIKHERFHNYIDSAIYALTKKDTAFKKNQTHNLFAARPDLAKLYYNKCSQNKNLTNAGTSQTGKKFKKIANEIQLFAVLISAIDMHAQMTGCYPFTGVIDLFVALVNIYNEFQIVKYASVQPYIHSETRCFSFITSTTYGTAFEYNKYSLSPEVIKSLKRNSDEYESGIYIPKINEFYSPEKIWYLL